MESTNIGAAMIDIDAIRKAITPDEWLAILFADEDGPLPPCCAEISALRDAIVTLPGPWIGDYTVAQALVAWDAAQEGHWEVPFDASDPLVRLMAALRRVYAEAGADPAMLTAEGLAETDRELDELMRELRVD